MILPTYNEAESLPLIAQALFNLNLPGFQMIIVDDASPDGTGDVADQLSGQYHGRISVIHRAGKLGLGSAYIEGFRAAFQSGAQAIGQMDADFSHPVDRLPVMLTRLSHADVVLGSRYTPGGSLDERWPAWRKALSAFGNFYARSILGLPMRDVTSGYRIWRRDSLAAMPLHRIRSNGYSFLIEMAYIASRLGYRFEEVPIHFAERTFGQSKMSLRIQLEAARRVWWMRLHYRDLHPSSNPTIQQTN